MAELKTKPTGQDVAAYLNSITDPQLRENCLWLAQTMKEITRSEPKMWGSSIVGFGSYHYKYASGREGDWLLTGFSPRQRNLTVYIMAGFAAHGELMQKLGKHSTGKSCLYIRSLSGIHRPTLKKLIRASVKETKELAKPKTKAQRA
jgi:Domain of unknown function (DU1801)